MDRGTVIYVYDGSFEGLLSAIFTAFERKETPCDMVPDWMVQACFDTSYRTIEADEARAGRVAQGICRRMGRVAYEKIWTVYLSGEPGCEVLLLRYIRLGMKQGMRIHSMLTDDSVSAVNKQTDLVKREAHSFIEFSRFSEREGGVYYASVHPRYRILPLIMPHFYDRFRTHPFLIYDEVHVEVGVSDGRQWLIRDGEGMAPPALTADEKAYRKMWQVFYRTVSIKERENPALRRKWMPKKYEKYLVERRE